MTNVITNILGNGTFSIKVCRPAIQKYDWSLKCSKFYFVRNCVYLRNSTNVNDHDLSRFFSENCSIFESSTELLTLDGIARYLLGHFSFKSYSEFNANELDSKYSESKRQTGIALRID